MENENIYKEYYLLIDFLSEEMGKKGFSSRELGKKANMSYVFLHRGFSGKANFSLASLVKICLAMDISLASFFENINKLNIEHSKMITFYEKCDEHKKRIVIDLLNSFVEAIEKDDIGMIDNESDYLDISLEDQISFEMCHQLDLIRKKRNFSYRELAEKTEISYSQIHKIMSSNVSVSSLSFINLCHALNVPGNIVLPEKYINVNNHKEYFAYKTFWCTDKEISFLNKLVYEISNLRDS